MYGSLIVDEEVYQKFEGSLVPAGTAGILFPIEKIPEDSSMYGRDTLYTHASHHYPLPW